MTPSEEQAVRNVSARLIPVLVGAGSLAAGFACGFLAGKRRAEKAAEARVEKEIDGVKGYYRQRLELQTQEAEAAARARWSSGNAFPGAGPAEVAVPGPGDNEDEWRPTVENLGPAGEELRGIAADELRRAGPAPHHPPGIPLTPAGTLPDDDADEDTNRGDSSPGLSDPGDDGTADPDFWPAEDPATQDEPELSPVDGGLEPVVITRTQYYDDEEETGFQKVGIVYYEADKVLADDKDVPIRDHGSIVGEDFALHFGSADDPDIVYIRNNRLRIDFEIVRVEVGYAQHILDYGRPQ